MYSANVDKSFVLMNNKLSGKQVIEELNSLKDEKQKEVLTRFFKTQKGEYGEGDIFLGIKVPQTREIAKKYKELPLNEVHNLLISPIHEIRLCGFLILVLQMKQELPTKTKIGDAKKRDTIVEFYLQHAKYANNWDLVDLSCSYILGEWLLCKNSNGNFPSRDILYKLSKSNNLWEQRISIVTNWILIKKGEYNDILNLSESMLSHQHQLIHKAIGWMLRELGKKDIYLLRQFLEKNIKTIPRTTLRYAIEKMDSNEREYWMKK